MTVGTLEYRIPELSAATGVAGETAIRGPGAKPVANFESEVSAFTFAVSTKEEEWASEDILTPEVLAAFHRASEELLAKRPSS